MIYSMKFNRMSTLLVVSSAHTVHIFKLEADEERNNRKSGGSGTTCSRVALEEYDGGYEAMFEKKTKTA